MDIATIIVVTLAASGGGDPRIHAKQVPSGRVCAALAGRVLERHPTAKVTCQPAETFIAGPATESFDSLALGAERR